MVLLMRVIAVVISSVGVVTSAGWSIISPPTIFIVPWVSDLCGLMSQNIFPYVTFPCCGTCYFVVKKIVFDPETLFPTPCASILNSLEKDL